MPCEHHNFRVDAVVNRIEDVKTFSVDLRIVCTDCNVPFEWIGAPHGFSYYQPCMSIDNQELRAPIVPRGETVPGGLAGFRIAAEGLPDEVKQ